MIIPNKEKPRKNEMSVWSVATGRVNLFNKASREAAKYITTLKGFVAVHPHLPDGIMWLFDTKENAHMAKAQMEDKGIHTGTNICEVFIDKNYLKEE